jgi:hypothetical protein
MPLAGQKARIAARGPTSARKSGRTAKSMPPAELTSRLCPDLLDSTFQPAFAR